MNDEKDLTPLDLHIIFTTLFIKNLNPHRDNKDMSEINWIKDCYIDWKNSYSNSLNYDEVKTSMSKFIDECFI